MAKVDTKKFISLDEVLRKEKDPRFLEAYRTRRFVHAIAAAVRTMREAAGLTQAELAEKIGTKQPAIARLERSAHQAPQWRLLEKIAGALGKQLKLVFEDATADERSPVEVRSGNRNRKRASHAAGHAARG